MSSTVEPTVANPSESLFGIEGLVGHLRSTKHSTTARPEVLAQQFGLPEGFVQDVLDALHRPHSAQHRTRAAWRSAWTAIGTVYFKARGAWLWATEKPIWFVVVTGGAVYLANFLTYAYALSQTSTQGRIVVQYGAVFLWVYALHLLSFARHGKLRFPVIGGGLLVVVNLLTSLRSGGLGVADSAMSNLASFLAYSVPGAIAALIGGYVRASKQETALRTLSRQEAMQKLFGLRESLKKSQSPIDRARDQNSFIARLFAARTWPLQAILTGFVVGLLRTFCIWVYQVVFPAATEKDPSYFMAQFSLAILTIAAFLCAGFFSGSIRKALVSQLLVLAGLLFSGALTGGYSPELDTMRDPVSLMTFLLLFGLTSGVGAKVHVAAQLETRRTRNEPASIVAEIVLLERLLNADQGARCVASIDIARSTAMKANQDPLAVEWSFREYHTLLAECAADAGGQVMSTSGDGAVLTFSDCEDALMAAKDIQTKLSWFNQKVNRLDSPFRARIGLHTGEVGGELEDVQFTHVIDIAAHVQALAPVGGILVSEKVVEKVTNEKFSELKDPVDDIKVFLVVNPTLGA